VQARVIVVAGPSGSGKSLLCRRLSIERGWPVVNLDDFYKDGDDPTLPRTHLPAGAPIVDWDHPDSWLGDDAVAALAELCSTGRVEVPVYDIASDGRVGRAAITLDGSAYVLAEGIFADAVVGPCRDRGVLGDAVCVHNSRLTTFWRRLTRDLRESRKPPWVLVRRGVALLRAEPAVVRRAVRAGCVVLTSKQAYARLAALGR
jgi:uridine kinase